MTVLEEIFLNKRVEVKIPYRDEFGKQVPGKFDTAVGICKFIGENKWLGIPLQITIDRTPFEVKHINDVKLWEKKKNMVSHPTGKCGNIGMQKM